MPDALPYFTLTQLRQIINQLGAVQVDGLPLFKVQIINAHNDRPIRFQSIKSFGMIYLRVNLAGYAKDFPMMVQPEEVNS